MYKKSKIILEVAVSEVDGFETVLETLNKIYNPIKKQKPLKKPILK